MPWDNRGLCLGNKADPSLVAPRFSQRVSENSSDHHIVVLLQKAGYNTQKGGVVVHEQNGNRVHLVRAKGDQVGNHYHTTHFCRACLSVNVRNSFKNAPYFSRRTGRDA